VKVSSLGEYLLYPPVFLFYRISGLNLKGFRTLEKTLNLLYCDTGCVHVDVHISTRYTNPGKGATSAPFSVGITGGLYCFLPLDKTIICGGGALSGIYFCAVMNTVIFKYPDWSILRDSLKSAGCSDIEIDSLSTFLKPFAHTASIYIVYFVERGRQLGKSFEELFACLKSTWDTVWSKQDDRIGDSDTVDPELIVQNINTLFGLYKKMQMPCKNLY